MSCVQQSARWGYGPLLAPRPPGINGAFHREGSRGPAIGRLLEGRRCARGKSHSRLTGHPARLWVARLGLCLPRTLQLTMTLLVTAPSRRSGGTRSSRAAMWISAQLDTAATCWDSLWTEEGGGRESAACGMATAHRAGARPRFARQAALTQRHTDPGR